MSLERQPVHIEAEIEIEYREDSITVKQRRQRRWSNICVHLYLCQRIKRLLIAGLDQFGNVGTGVVLILGLQVLWHFDELDIRGVSKRRKDGLSQLHPGVSLTGAKIIKPTNERM